MALIWGWNDFRLPPTPKLIAIEITRIRAHRFLFLGPWLWLLLLLLLWLSEVQAHSLAPSAFSPCSRLFPNNDDTLMGPIDDELVTDGERDRLACYSSALLLLIILAGLAGSLRLIVN